MSFRRYRPYQKNEFIVVGVDTSWGGTDYSCAQFLSKTSLDVPVVYHSKVLASEMTPLIHLELEKIYDQTGIQPVVSFERNNGGVAELERLATLNRSGKYRIATEQKGVGTTDATEATVKLGWTTSSASRPIMLSMLKEAIDSKLIRIYDKPTVNEMFSFIVSQTQSRPFNCSLSSVSVNSFTSRTKHVRLLRFSLTIFRCVSEPSKLNMRTEPFFIDLSL